MTALADAHHVQDAIEHALTRWMDANPGLVHEAIRDGVVLWMNRNDVEIQNAVAMGVENAMPTPTREDTR